MLQRTFGLDCRVAIAPRNDAKATTLVNQEDYRMRKILLFLFVLLMGVQLFAADVVPRNVNSIRPDTLGFYQAENVITLYEKPWDNAKIIRSFHWDKTGIYPEGIRPGEFFAVYIPGKNLAFLTVADEMEGWVEVVFNNRTGERGWLKKDDPYRFLNWFNFVNMYGKKYGMNILSGAGEQANVLYSAPEDGSQIVGRINHPQKINLTVLRGNWALVSVYDMDKTPKTGYIRWRSDNGVKYLFPSVK